MRHTVKLPKLGDTAEEVVVIEIYKAVGDDVAEGDALILVETNKAEIDVPSPIAGRVAELLVSRESQVTTGAAIVILETNE